MESSSSLQLAELIFVQNMKGQERQEISFQCPSLSSGKDLFCLMLNLFEHGITMLFARPDVNDNMVFIKDLTMQDMDKMKQCLSYAGIELSVTKHPGRILSTNHYTMALTSKKQDSDDIEDFSYLVDLPSQEHVNISFRLMYNHHPSYIQPITSCGFVSD